MSKLEVKNVMKLYPGVIALDNVSISFENGKVHAIIGKNGSGKSTLVKILSGAVEPTAGEILMDGESIKFTSPADAFSKGIATVYQELSLIPGLTVAENILIGRLPMKGKFVDWKETYKKAKELLDDMKVDIPPNTMVYKLSMWQRQMVEIVKAMSFQPKVLLLDEPTSALAQSETEALFNMIRELKKKDVIIIYISHRLKELWEIADTCTVLRDGKLIGTVSMDKVTHQEVVNMMFGNIEIRTRPADIKVSDEIVLEVRNLSRKKYFKDISFQLKKGEILGIAGMLGSGRTELLRSILGIDSFDRGEIIYKGEKIIKPNPIKMKQKGFALVPEDRRKEGLIQTMTIKDNLCITSLDLISKGAFIEPHLEKEFAERQVKTLKIKVANILDPIFSLSGGNQQKVVVGKWLNTNPEIVFFDEPSRGIDVEAKQQIFQIIWELSRKGISSIFVSSELEELLEVCHRILIMRDGRIVDEVLPENITVEELYSLCMGGEKNEVSGNY
ncbi:sugar ABC transporter ATP-binding protein [Thermoanaerobacter uzonensis]|uniref:sugar ABC transporter ATP-binding protein n=1 Tax=Thermoanaerobacter uzonensis TaxID=447593 RepID=UPI003D769D37